MKTLRTLFILLLATFFSQAVVAQDYQYVGAAKCKMCHSSTTSGQQYQKWMESSHANAMKTLSSAKSLEYAKKNNIKDPATEPSCVKCHSTAGSISSAQNLSITVAEGVSCESCHGPGSKYKSMTIMKDRALALQNGLIIPDQKTCIKCHNKDNPFYKPFNYETAKAKIAHPKP